MRPWKGKAKVERLVLEHLAQVRETIGFFGQATRAHFVDKDEERAEHFALQTHTSEGKADDTRRDVERAIRLLFTGPREEALERTARVEQREGKIDHIERKLTKRLFKLDLDLAAKLHVHGYIAELVKISDRAEDLADRIALVVAERAI